MISGNLDSYNLMPISINDLLGREVVNADKNLLGMGVKEKVVLITGAGGSIGSELSKQICYLHPKKIILFDKAQIIGEIVPNVIAFGLFLGAIGYFALTGKMAEMFGWKDKN